MTWTHLLRKVVLSRPWRSVLAAVSVALGVAVYVAVSIGSANLSESLAGRVVPGQERFVAFRPVGVGETTVPTSKLDELAALPGVDDAYGTLQATILVRSPRGSDSPTTISIVGIPSQSATSGLWLPSLQADALGVRQGDTMIVSTADGDQPITVTGTGQPDGGGATDTASVATTSLDALARWVGRPDAMSMAVAVLDPTQDRETWIAEHGDDIPGMLTVQGDLFGSDDADAFFRSIADAISPLASAALVVASYLIFLTLSRTVAEQSKVYATMRTIGASRRQIALIVLSEAALLAAVGTLVGLAIGIAAGGVVAEIMRGIFGLSVTATHNVPGNVLITGAALGIVAPVLAAAVPAHRALTSDPAQGLHLATHHQIARPGTLRTASASVICALGIVGVATIGGQLQGIATIVVLVAAAVALPGLLVPVSRSLVRPIARAHPGPGELAAQDLSRRPGHAAATSALLAVTLAVVILVGTIIESTRPAFQHILEANYGTDYRVETASWDSFSPSQLEGIEALPQVEAATPYTVGNARIITNDVGPHFMTVIDPATYFEVAGLVWTPTTDATKAIEQLRMGGHVALERRIATAAKVAVGDTITLDTPTGPVDLIVAGTYYGLAIGETNAAVIAEGDASAHFGYTGPRELLINTRSGTTLTLEDTATTGPGLHLTRSRAIYDEIYSQLDGLYGLILAILFVTAGVGIFGLASTLVIDTIDRRDELDSLRTLGAARRDLRTFITTRSLILTTTASLAAVLLGGVLGAATISQAATTNQIPNAYSFPTTAALTVVVMSLLVGGAASVQPARLIGYEQADQ